MDYLFGAPVCVDLWEGVGVPEIIWILTQWLTKLPLLTILHCSSVVHTTGIILLSEVFIHLESETV